MILNFTQPFYLVFLFIIPITIFLHFYFLKNRKSNAIKFANFDAIARIKGVDILSKNLSTLILSSIIMVLLVFSLSGMTIQRQIKTSESSFVLAIDSSRSMEADDFFPSRLEAAKTTANDFIDALPSGTNIGVISFSGNAFIETFPTNDKISSKTAVSQIPISAIGGTDLYEAVLTSTNLLQSEEVRTVILLSDGQINVGTITDVIKYANANAVTVHTIALGTLEGGQTSYGLSTLDQESLQALAYNTDGQYFEASNAQELGRAFLNTLEINTYKINLELSTYLLIAALILFAIQFVLSNTHFISLP